MPASICDPVSSALRLSLSAADENQSSALLDSRLYSSAKNVLLSKIEFEESGDYQSNVLDGLKSKYVVIRPKKPILDGKIIKKEGNSSAENIKKVEDGLPKPKRVLFSVENVQLGWQTSWAAGAGMQNVGNTCYLNSTLQALFHVPAFANWLVSEGSHSDKCNQQEACIICGMRATLLATQKSGGAPIKPWQVYSKLRLICRHLTPGRQEDAHEFLRYLVEAMEKCYLSRFINTEKIDQYSKETTPLNQILGGYLRSTVRCLSCHHLSTTYQHFQDLLLDIRKHSTLDEALDSFFSRERLEDLGYKCEGCNKKVSATKQFFIERAPMVLCIALKRFSLVGGKLSKHVQFRKKISLNKYNYHKNNNQQLSYKLVSLVTHLGPSQNCGHYTAIGQAPNCNYYQFDDSCVRPVPLSAVLGTNAYIMFFEKDNTVEESSGPVASTSSAVYGPQLPANHILNRDKSPLKLTFYRNDERKPIILNNNSSKLVKPDTKPIILNSTLSNPTENSNSEPWILKQNGDVEKVIQPPKILNGTDKTLKIDEDKKLSFVIKRPGEENGHPKPKLSKSDSDLRAIGTVKAAEKVVSVKLVKPPKSPLEKLEEQMNKNASPVKNGGSKLVDYDSESSSDDKGERTGDCKGKKGCKEEESWKVAASGAAWSVSRAGPGAPSRHGDTNANREEKEESRMKSESPNTSLSSMSPLSDRSEHQNSINQSNNTSINKQDTSTTNGKANIVNVKCNIVTNGVNGKINFTNGKINVINVNGKIERKENENSGNNVNGNSMLGSHETVRQLQNLSHRGYGAPVSTWNETHSNLSRQVTEERIEQRKRARESADEIDRGRNKKVKKFHRYPQYGRPYNPFQEKQSKGVWGAWQRDRRPHHRHHNKYRRFNRYNNGHHYPRHH